MKNVNIVVIVKGKEMIKFILALFSLVVMVGWVDALPTSIVVRETAGIYRVNEPVRFGIPLKQGDLKSVTGIRISGHPCQLSSLSYYSDSSYRFVLCRTLVSVDSLDSTTLVLSTGSNTYTADSVHVDSGAIVTVSNNKIKFEVRQARHNFINRMWYDSSGNREFEAEELVIDSTDSSGSEITIGGARYKASAYSVSSIEIEEWGPIEAVVVITGRHRNVEYDSLRYVTRIHAYAGKSYLRIEHSIINGYSPAGSQSSSGTSTYYHEVDRYRLKIYPVVVGDITTGLVAGADTAWTDDTATIYQRALSLKSDSMQYTYGPTTKSGRANAYLNIKNSRWGIALMNRYFHERFPSGLRADATGASWDLMPDDAPKQWLVGSMGAPFELMIYCHGPTDSAEELEYGFLRAPLHPIVTASEICRTQAFGKMITEAVASADNKRFYRWLDSCVASTSAIAAQHLLYGPKDFGDIPEYLGEEGTEYAVPYTNAEEANATVWGGNFYDPEQTVARASLLLQRPQYIDWLHAASVHTVETDLLNSERTGYYWNGLMPAAGIYHRGDNNSEKSFLGGPFYSYQLLGTERIKDRMVEGAGNVIASLMPITAGYARQTYQNGEVLLETYKITNDHRYLDSCGSILHNYFTVQNDSGAIIYPGESYPEQTKMQALVCDLGYKYLQEKRDSALAVNIIRNVEFFNRIGAANNSTVGCRKTVGVEDYWNHCGTADIMYYPDFCDVVSTYGMAYRIMQDYPTIVTTCNFHTLCDDGYTELSAAENLPKSVLFKGEAKTGRQLTTGLGACYYDEMGFPVCVKSRVW